ncbi:MAG: amino acid permease [Mycobacteriaceae bacterium]|uniref:amino acid permease n=1 Tax=Corynebacterium sp. TaxID=1720 RepID=UPI003F9DE801
MTWIFLGAVVLVSVVGAVLLPRRARGGESQDVLSFPWFWVVFPLTVLATMCAVGLLVAAFSDAHLVQEQPVPWALPYPDSTIDGLQFISGEQWRDMVGPLAPVFFFWFWPIAAVTGIGLCVWAWRSGRW